MKRFLLVAILFSGIKTFAQPASFHVQGKFPSIYVTHAVANGETFLSLAKFYNLSPNAIAAFNSLKLSANLTAGDSIKIPAAASNFYRIPQISLTNSFIPVIYSPAATENTYSISKRFARPDTILLKLNSLTDRSIKAGSNVVIGFLKIRKNEKAVLPAPVATTPQPVQAPSTNTSAVFKNDDTVIAAVKDFGSDKLFEEARRVAFDKKDYTTALKLCKFALGKSPDYSDIRIFAGRIYTWTDRIDSAVAQFEYVILHDVENKDVYVAYADLLYWNDKYPAALEICEKGLTYYPTSKDLQIRKVKILKALKRPAEAQLVLQQLLKQDRGNTEARAMLERNKDEILRNKIGLSYDYTYFDKQFSDPWHIGSIDYSRQTKVGSIGGHINYANRFRTSALQYELEAYPHISKHFYSYVSAAYSKNSGVFPRFRSGFSLYALLPKSMEGEVGFRYLYFSSPTLIYTAALGKYYKSWLFTARTYLTPGDNNISQSYNLTTRYYYGGADDYYSFTIGHGISPDDKPVVVLLNKAYPKLVSTKVAAGYKHEFNRKYILTFDLSWINQEYRPKTKGNQLSTGVSLQMRF